MSVIENTNTTQEFLKGKSLDELLAIITAAAAEAKKAAKVAAKSVPKEKAEKKGSMPKGVVPAQLHKPRAWVDFVLADANARGWPAITVKGQEEPLPASIEKDGKHVFEKDGKPLNNKQAMSLSKQYWDRKAAVGTHKHLYEVFEGQYVAPDPSAPVEPKEPKAPKAAKEPKAPKVEKTEEEKLAEKEAKAAAKKAEKEAKKEAKKEAEKAEKEIGRASCR